MLDIQQNDLTGVRAEWVKAAKDNPNEYRRRVESDFLSIKTDAGKVDFHSLRHTFAMFLVQNGTDIKTCQSLLRHSTPAMTLGIYTHARDENLIEAVDNSPDFVQKQVAVLTGTDNFSVDAIAENKDGKNTPKITPNRPAKAGINRHNLAQANQQKRKSRNVIECN